MLAVSATPDITIFLRGTVVPHVTHRLEKSVAGRPFLIEVAPVAQNRWRACLARVPGVQTALMPFYGSTPDEAARQLTDWLNRAHRRAGTTTAG